jgi:hypothetical protein
MGQFVSGGFQDVVEIAGHERNVVAEQHSFAAILVAHHEVAALVSF